MHGRPRKAPTDEEQQVSSCKAAKLRDLQAQVLHFHHHKIYTKEAIKISAKLLESNPEHYTGWNYRKLAVQFLLDQLSGKGDDSAEATQSILNEELKVVENALRKNYKSYGAWHHRKWVLSKGHSSTDRELRLLGMFCKLDARNFHAWNYRRFITTLKEIPDEEELQYTTDVIYDNFSNYSAWHNRSVLLSKLLKKRVRGYDVEENVLKDEYEFVRNALFTDPDDQSGWFYYLWLLGRTLKREPALLSSWPPQGSHLYLAHDAKYRPFPAVHFHPKARMLPVILYFSEAVEGVSSSTVTVKCEYHTSNNLSWRPLSVNKYGSSQAWMAYLEFPDELNLLDTFSVKVAIANFPGISSSSGEPFGQSCDISFTVSVTSDDNKVHSEAHATDRISWREENFISNTETSEEERLLHLLHKVGITAKNNSTDHSWRMETISNEISHCRELLSATNCKIGKLTLARLLMPSSILISNGGRTDVTEVHYEDILALYHDLVKMDPAHTCYYEDEYSLALLKQMISDVEPFLKRCGQYHESSSPSTDHYSSLRLNGLSLSRIGSTENFLWVQMLDLGHNNLHTLEGWLFFQLIKFSNSSSLTDLTNPSSFQYYSNIWNNGLVDLLEQESHCSIPRRSNSFLACVSLHAGLEVLQLLSCLKLSHNRFSSFTALEPLKLLSSLKVLDISHNEIGAHSIDTRRYLCSSPLTHTVEMEWHFDKFTESDAKSKDPWDAHLLFKGMNLIQLDIIGNEVVDDRLRALLRELMPTLKWLDGLELS